MPDTSPSHHIVHRDMPSPEGASHLCRLTTKSIQSDQANGEDSVNVSANAGQVPRGAHAESIPAAHSTTITAPRDAPCSVDGPLSTPTTTTLIASKDAKPVTKATPTATRTTPPTATTKVNPCPSSRYAHIVPRATAAKSVPPKATTNTTERNPSTQTKDKPELSRAAVSNNKGTSKDMTRNTQTQPKNTMLTTKDISLAMFKESRERARNILQELNDDREQSPNKSRQNPSFDSPLEREIDHMAKQQQPAIRQQEFMENSVKVIN